MMDHVSCEISAFLCFWKWSIRIIYPPSSSNAYMIEADWLNRTATASTTNNLLVVIFTRGIPNFCHYDDYDSHSP